VKMTKRFLAGIVAIFILVSCTGCITQKTETLSGGTSEKENENAAINVADGSETRDGAYKNIVQHIVDNYGVLQDDAFDKADDTEDITGLWEAKTFDVTGDGEEELFLVYLKNNRIYAQVYEYENGIATQKWDESFDYCGLFNLIVYRNNNGAHWLCSVNKNEPYSVTGYVNGEYKTLYTHKEYTQADLDAFNSGDPYVSSPATRIYEDLKYKLGIDSFDEYDSENMLLALYAEGILINVNEDELVSRFGINIPKPKYSAEDALSEIKYYGDTSKCKMTKEMALAYAEALDSKKSIVENNSGTQFDLHTALLDLSDDGMPILVAAVVARYDGYLLPMGQVRPGFFVWTWDGKNAQEYDFIEDVNIEHMSGVSFISNPGAGKIRVCEGGMNISQTHGALYYDVSNAQLSLTHHETLYVATLDAANPEYAFGTDFPGVDSHERDDGKLVAKVSDLEDAGWVTAPESGARPFYMLWENGSFKPFDDYDEFIGWQDNRYYCTGDLVDVIDFDMEMGFIVGTAEMGDGYVAADALRKYADAYGKPTYSYDDVLGILGDSVVEEIAKKVAKEYGGEVGEIYKLSDDLYYVIIYIDGEVSGTVVIKNTDNGSGWRIIKTSDKPMTEEDLAKEVGKDERIPNITIDFDKIGEGPDYIEGVLQDIDGTCLNPSAEEELIKFIVASITRCTGGFVKSGNNIILIGAGDIKSVSDKAKKLYDEYMELLKKYDIVLTRPVTIIIQFVVRGADCKKPVQFKLTQSMLDGLGDADELSFILDGSSCSFRISKVSLELIIEEYGEITVVLQDKGNGVYIIQFVDADGNIIQKLCAPITFFLPAENELCTIGVEYTGGTDNWGGQFDPVNLVLMFDARYSGTYTVLDEQIDIGDIDSLTEEEKKIIRFMVSKGFFELDGNNFYPDENLTRYAFAKALVKVCFEVDYDAETGLLDMTKDNPYYHYVASCETKGIIEGYDDNMFHGEDPALRDQVIALCARTLKTYKDYSEPEDPWNYLHFNDNDSIVWGHGEIALAVRQALIEDGGFLNPESPASRKDAALILYRLFMLLNEVEPVSLITDAPSSNGGPSVPIWPIAGAAAGVAAIGGGATLVLLKRKKAAKLAKKAAEVISGAATAKPSADVEVSAETENPLPEDKE